MARGANQKLKLFRLAEIMQQKTDEEHYLTMPEILEELEKYDIFAERKSIYNDLKELEELGIDVVSEQRGKLTYYHVVGRKFELPELKLLVDAIQSSKFITVKKTNDLIKKLESFCSEYEARQLHRQVFVQDRIKAMNESVYYSVDAIHAAISENKKISFQYFKWNTKKEAELKKNGEFYIVSPWALSWDDENYYLVAYDSEAGKIKHYRVDKLLKISMIDEAREGRQLFEKFNAADYAKRNFGMFGGEEESVSLEIDNDMCGVFIDRFGKDISFVAIDEKRSSLRLKVALSRHFIGWIIALGPGVRITGSKKVLELMNEEIKRLQEQYNI